ncbi:MAG: DUF5620 domain-containing protein, partial [Ruminococcus sp.]
MVKWKSYLAAFMAAVSLGTVLSGCSGGEESTGESTAETTAAKTTAAEEEITEAEEETTEAPTEAATEHVSPIETVSTTLGAEVSGIDAILDRDGDNTYKAKLSDFIEEGDSIHSFTFIFYSTDGVSDMGTYKGGCGISVTDECTAATDEGWYQSDDFEYSVNGAYAEITWNVPGDVSSYIDENGEVLIGYWWSDVQE